MFEEQKIVPTLGDKIKELIEKYKEATNENEKLRNEIVAVKAQNEALTSRLGKLEEDMVVKNLTEDELFKEIENVLDK
ncbi:hypothetical protein [Campylobacter ureolyticus]|uniref:hypothetical protein n=1 Tax=Campylobacter ureolyticus TaxID=827 RepID=UPI001FC7C0E6|nr:hypothetical protein [Campylobacter ureolyticus]MCZ6103832.1 hypothetical protein [Campylobacter ureolyticus]MCZ6105837.1 hypothetical protein [Campylobacter ureolyticus]MCZ6111747.1 hypothetical protein [Campylobacter ureolyticus]MCZ6134716.1 hypothetical protein [Campylobacter ureolyticus]MCZ6158463.1 hypothetical protein [Campylobacter ureolyticus]